MVKKKTVRKVVKAVPPTPEELENVQLDPEVYNVSESPEISNEVLGIPDPDKYISGVNPNNPEPEVGSVEKELDLPDPMDTVNVPEPVLSDPTPDELMTEKELAELDAQQIEDLTPYNVKVGYPVVYEGNHAALITKVLDNGLVNLIVFHDGHPVPDVKTEVPYQSGVNLYNTWKEII